MTIQKLAFLSILLILFSCETDKNAKSKSKIDTILVSFQEIDEAYIKPKEYTLVKEQKGDSLLSFRYYYKLSKLQVSYDFNIKNGGFKLIQKKHEEDKLIVVDTFETKIESEKIQVFKYEVENPPIDGQGAVLFSRKYGKIADISYSWWNYYILNIWNGEKISKELKDILFADYAFYKNPRLLPYPPPDLINTDEKPKDVEKDLN